MASGKGSGDIEFDAAHVLSLNTDDKNQPPDSNTDLLHVGLVKNRYGALGNVNLGRDRTTLRIAEIDTRAMDPAHKVVTRIRENGGAVAMQPDTDGYSMQLTDGWQLTVSAVGNENIAWLTNDRLANGFYETTVMANIFIDLERAGFVPTVYHEGTEAPPLVLFHAARSGIQPWVWEPATGRVYEAGTPGAWCYSRIANGR